MSIALERGSGNTIQRSGLIHGMSCISIYDSPNPGRPVSGDFAGHRRFPVNSGEREEELGSCSSSSIGRNSDLSEGSSDGDDSGETEVQSSFKGPLDTMDALEEVLPIGLHFRRGISKFYSGKSKSFTSLADVSSSSSVKDLAKPENAYTKKRKNLLASSNLWDKNRNYPLRSNGGGISKRPANSSRSTLALGVSMSSSGSYNSSEDSNSNSFSPPRCLPPLPPQSKRSPNNGSSSPPRQNFSTLRSFSLSDLQCIAPATPSITGLMISDRVKDNKPH